VNKSALLLIIVFVCTSLVYAAGIDTHAPEQYDRDSFTEEMHISRGGQLYDDWWSTAANTLKPGGDHPLWKGQDSNTRSGYDTYRCKECHGWDYRGKDGAYGKGSHYTGFVGVYKASHKMTVKELKAVLRGSTNKEHDFSAFLNKKDISDLALFMKKGVINIGKFIYPIGTPIGGDYERGKNIYRKACMAECHGPKGKAINFGSEESPEFIGTLAKKNPWEYLHKSRVGQPGTRMLAGIIYGWDDDDIRDLMRYTINLPQEDTGPGFYERLKIRLGWAEEAPKSRILKKYRGFGPKTE
jgi:cytochrome c553